MQIYATSTIQKYNIKGNNTNIHLSYWQKLLTEFIVVKGKDTFQSVRFCVTGC